ncbi:hypothetical protein [Bradyrhizobium arachidis]|uniref:hypothetical protein n=1 Tax=Bradyrhizobium arachidis TaxID=858423 RepID=UPI001FCDBFD3|nr:hypothetical protein [Bradyrhizobium arachidis]
MLDADIRSFFDTIDHERMMLSRAQDCRPPALAIDTQVADRLALSKVDRSP